jgi:MATE family multidrug resistance protein
MKRTLKELKTTMALAFPMMAGQLSQMLLGLADTLMIGRVGTVELAAAAFVNVLFHIPIILGIAITAAVSVRVSHAHGANEHEEAGEAFRHGTILALLVGAVTGLAIPGVHPLSGLLRPTGGRQCSRSPLPLLGHPFRHPHDAGDGDPGICRIQGPPLAVFWISMGGVLLNIVLNYLLIFGKLGFPELGLTGAGMATFVSRVLTLVWLWIYVRGSRTLAESCPEHWLAPIQRIQWTRLIKLALPIGGQIAMEFGMIAVTALLIGHFGAVQMAAHQIAITCAATTFMLPLGLSMALTIRVGHSIGAGAIERCRRIIIGAHGTGFLIMATAATIYLIFREDLAQFFSRDPEVIGLTASLLIITAVFQIFDSLQVISMGALRGMQDTRVPTWIVFISYWIITLPMGCVLAYTALPGALGFWTALAIGLAIAAIALTVRAGMNLSNGAGINTESA